MGSMWQTLLPRLSFSPSPASYPHFPKARELDPCQSTKTPLFTPTCWAQIPILSGQSLVIPPSALYLCVSLLLMLPTFMELQVTLLFVLLLVVSCFGEKRGYKKVFTLPYRNWKLVISLPHIFIETYTAKYTGRNCFSSRSIGKCTHARYPHCS